MIGLHFHALEPSSIHPTALIGLPPQMRDYQGGSHKGVEVADGARIGAFCSIDGGWERTTLIGRCWLMKSVHVGHDAVIADGVQIAPMTSIAGYVELDENVKVGQGVVFKQYVKVGANAVIGMGAVVTKDVPAGETWAGNPAKRLERSVVAHIGEYAQLDDDMWLEQYSRGRV